jgi:hypothetical protein
MSFKLNAPLASDGFGRLGIEYGFDISHGRDLPQ